MQVKGHGQGHKVKYFGTDGKALSQGIHMRNMKVLPLMVQKLINVGQRSQSMSQGQNIWY